MGGGLSKHAALNLHACAKKGGKKPWKNPNCRVPFFVKYVLLHMPEHTLKHAPGLKKTSGQSIMTVGGDAERGGGKKRGAPLNYSVPPTVTHKHKGRHFFWVPTDI